MEPGARTPPTEPLKRVSRGEHVRAVHQEVEHPVGVAGRVERADLQPADLEHRLAGLDRAVHVLQALAPRAGAPGSPRRSAPCRRRSPPRGRTWWWVSSRWETVDPVLLDLLQQRPGWPARVDHHGRAARLVGHEVGVGQPVGVHGALDDHRSAQLSISPVPRRSALEVPRPQAGGLPEHRLRRPNPARRRQGRAGRAAHRVGRGPRRRGLTSIGCRDWWTSSEGARQASSAAGRRRWRSRAPPPTG